MNGRKAASGKRNRAATVLATLALGAMLSGPALAQSTNLIQRRPGAIDVAIDVADVIYYELWNSSAVADVMWASTAEFQGVFLWPDNQSFSQEFELLDSGGGYFRLMARHSGQSLMLDWRAGDFNGTRVMQYPYCDPGYAGSEWRVQWVYTSRGPNGYPQSIPTLVNRATGRCLDANSPRSTYPPVQSVLQQWDCVMTAEDWNAGNQRWDIVNAHQVYTPPR